MVQGLYNTRAVGITELTKLIHRDVSQSIIQSKCLNLFSVEIPVFRCFADFQGRATERTFAHLFKSEAPPEVTTRCAE